jgi:hypothetical protein
MAWLTQCLHSCRLPQQRPSWTWLRDSVPVHAGGSSQAAPITYAAPTTLQQARRQLVDSGTAGMKAQVNVQPHAPLLSPEFSSTIVSYMCHSGIRFEV